MANLLDIRRRIKSVKNTQQITRAMKMMSAARLKRAQDRVVAARPFANKMLEVMGDLAARTDEGLDKVFIIYNEFRSVLQQRVVIEQLLPVSHATESEDAARPVDMTDYIYEQEPSEIFSRLLPRVVETQIFRALLESVASEHGARMTAMDSASKNAGELISSLTLNMNRIRQAAITNEIIEVVSGAAAL